MEYMIALLAALVTTAAAVLIAVNIEKGKSWALEIARTISLLNPNSLASPHMLVEADTRPEAQKNADAEPEDVQEGSDQRLAA